MGPMTVSGEYLQQQSLAVLRRAVDEYLVLLQPVEILAVSRHALVDCLVVGVRDVHESDPARGQRLHGLVDVVARERDVLNALAPVRFQILLYLGLVVGGLVDGDADLSAGARHGAGLEAGALALDIEETDLLEIEQPFVEARPLVHASVVDVVSKVIHVGEAGAVGVTRHAFLGDEIHIIYRVIAVTIDEIDETLADAAKGGDVELHGADGAMMGRGAALHRLRVRVAGVGDPDGEGAGRRTVDLGEGSREAIRLVVDDEVDTPLAVQDDPLRAVPRDGREAHLLEQVIQQCGIGSGVLDELEAVGAHGVVGRGGHGESPAM